MGKQGNEARIQREIPFLMEALRKTNGACGPAQPPAAWSGPGNTAGARREARFRTRGAPCNVGKGEQEW